jgi:hypothetical protein
MLSLVVEVFELYVSVDSVNNRKLSLQSQNCTKRPRERKTVYEFSNQESCQVRHALVRDGNNGHDKEPNLKDDERNVLLLHPLQEIERPILNKGITQSVTYSVEKP